jgi:hypothetical protein
MRRTKYRPRSVHASVSRQTEQHGDHLSEPQPQLRCDTASGSLLGIRSVHGELILYNGGCLAADAAGSSVDAVDILRAFDVNRARIYTIAAKVYARGRKGSYDLNVDDV